MNAKDLNNEWRQSWARAYLDFYHVLLAKAHKLTHDSVRAQDLVQDTLLRCLTYAPNPEKIIDPLSYLIRCMRNTWIDHFRPHQMLSLDDPASAESLETNLVVEPDLMRRLESEELLKTIRFEQRRLSDHEKQLLVFLVEGYTTEDIADRLNQNIRVIRADVNALKAKLRYRYRSKTRKERRPTE